MGENKGMFDDWSKTFKEINAGFADLGQSIEDMESQAEDYIAAEAERNRTHNEAMKEVLKNAHHLEELSKIAKAAQKQAELAEAEARDSQKEARFSKIVSILSLAVAVASFIGQFFVG